MATNQAIVLDAAAEALVGYASAQRTLRSQNEEDSGPAVLAALAAGSGGAGHEMGHGGW